MTSTSKITVALVDAQLAVLKTQAETLKVLGSVIGLRAQGESDVAKLSAIATECGAFWATVQANLATVTREIAQNESANEVTERVFGKDCKVLEQLDCVNEIGEITESLMKCAEYCRIRPRFNIGWLDDVDMGAVKLDPVDTERNQSDMAIESLASFCQAFESSVEAFGTLANTYVMQMLHDLVAWKEATAFDVRCGSGCTTASCGSGCACGSAGACGESCACKAGSSNLAASAPQSNVCPHGHSVCEPVNGDLCLCGFPVQGGK